MREAIGGGWLLGFVVLFIVLFSGYLAISINYTKAFKVKNEILNIIEENEGFTQSTKNLSNMDVSELEKEGTAESESLAVLKSLGYYTNDTYDCGDDGEFQTGGYCVKHVCTSKGNYYKVTTYLKFELDIINFTIKIPIRGETKIIYYDQLKNDKNCN